MSKDAVQFVQLIQYKKDWIGWRMNDKPMRNMIWWRLHPLQSNNLSSKIGLKSIYSSNHLSSRPLWYKEVINKFKFMFIEVNVYSSKSCRHKNSKSLGFCKWSQHLCWLKSTYIQVSVCINLEGHILLR